MPQRRLPPLNRQRGSILAGVVGLSAVLSAAAAGYILVSGQVRGGDLEAAKRTRLYYAAEAGMLMGARYVMKGWADETFNDNPELITTNAVSRGWKPIDGALDSVVLRRDAMTGRIWIEAWARETVPSDQVRIRWYVDRALPPTEPGTQCRLVMSGWTDTLFRKN